MIISIKKIYLILLLSLSLIQLTNNINARTVKTQKQFDEVIENLNSGDTVDIILKKGIYRLNEPIRSKAPLKIKGKNATIKSYTDVYCNENAVDETTTHYVCPLKSELNEFSLMIDQDGEIIPVAESVDEITLVNTAPQIIGEFDGRKTGLDILIPIPANLEHLKERSFSKAFGYFDCGWTTILFTLNAADKEYFYCKTLNSSNVPNINFEKKTYKHDIRFVIYNAEITKEKVYYDNKYIYIPKNVKQIYVKDYKDFHNDKSEIILNGDVELSGITFDGIEGVEINSTTSSICKISNCTFKHSLGKALSITRSSDNINQPIITGCKFEKCSILRNNILILKGSPNEKNKILVNNCELTRYPDAKLQYKNPSGMLYANVDAQILNSTFWNTPRCHIYLARGNTEVIGCTLYNTSTFNLARDRNLSSDWGLIYVNHIYKDPEEAINNKTNRILIEGCYLHGAYSHGNQARGVMIDDGRGDVTCRYNIVTDCQHFSLDSREVNSYISTSSIRNRFEYNILGCSYRIAGGNNLSSTEYPIINQNILLGEYNNIINENTAKIKKDTILPCKFETQNNKLYVNKNVFETLKKEFNNNYLNKYLHKLK